MSMERQVKGIIIPIELVDDRVLVPNEKMLLMEVNARNAEGKEFFLCNSEIKTEMMKVLHLRGNITKIGR